MPSIEETARAIVAREGGYVNDPDDPGGPTKYGVTLATLRGLRPGATLADLKRLTRDEAVTMFLDRYYRAPGIDRLPEALQPPVFDMQVNAGRAAITLLQELLTDLGEPVAADGILGPQTEAAAARAWDRAGELLVDAYGIARRNWYYALADRRPSSRKFARTRDGGKGGWIRRAEAFIAPRFRLTEAQHRERTAAWG